MAQARDIVRLEETDLEALVFSQEELEDHADSLRVDLEHNYDLLWIADASLRARLPPDWVAAEAVGEGVFYYNHRTRESQWEHPMDVHMINLVKKKQDRAALVLNMVASQSDDGMVVEVLSFSGRCMASVSVRRPDELSFGEFRPLVLAQIQIPEDAVPRFVLMNKMLGRSFDDLTVAEVFL